MQIILNEKNEIMSFASIGEIDDSRAREYEGELPDNFVEEFNPSAYLLDGNNIIAKNPDYVAPSSSVPIGPSDVQNIVIQQAVKMAQMQKNIMQQSQDIAKLKGANS